MKSLTVKVLLVCAVLGFAVLAAKADDGIHPTDSVLAEKLGEAETTIDIIEAYTYAHKEWDKELNENYKALMLDLSKARQEQLRASQREWIKHRDLEFKFNADFHKDKGGSMAGINIAEFQCDFVRKRARELGAYRYGDNPDAP